MYVPITQSMNKFTATFSETIVFLCFWGAKSEFEIKIAPYPISFGDNLKKGYFRIYDGKISYHYAFQATELNNEIRSVIGLTNFKVIYSVNNYRFDLSVYIYWKEKIKFNNGESAC